MKSKERFSYIFSICGLLLIIGFLAFLYFSGSLFGSIDTSISNIPLNSTVKLSVEKTKSDVFSFEIKGSTLPGEMLPQKISVLNTGESELFLRTKAFIFTDDQGKIEVMLNENENWNKNDDGYYYFNQKIQPNETVALANGLKLNEEYVLEGNKRYIVNVLLEALDGNLDPSNVWLS